MTASAPTRPSEVIAPSIVLTLHETRGEPRVDSRIIAKHLGVQRHQDTFELIKRYTAKFQKLGVLLFQTGKPPRASAGGRPERYALLNEDQAYFLLNLSRNTERVVDLKLKLIIAFRDARNRCVLHSHTYLPGYHELHDEVALLAQRAKEAGSQTDEAIFHININKLVNKTAGIEAGSRDKLTYLQKLMVANAQTVMRYTELFRQEKTIKQLIRPPKVPLSALRRAQVICWEVRSDGKAFQRCTHAASESSR